MKQAARALSFLLCASCSGAYPGRSLGNTQPVLIDTGAPAATPGEDASIEVPSQPPAPETPGSPNSPDSPETDLRCDFGAITNPATDDSLSAFAQTVYFPGDLPAGRYRATYVDGCMKYSTLWVWSVHGNTDQAFWLVAGDSDHRLAMPPGTIGVLNGLGAYDAFEDCVRASLALAPVEFAFTGGRLGLWLNDFPYDDNVAGENGRNPTWQLTRFDGPCAE